MQITIHINGGRKEGKTRVINALHNTLLDLVKGSSKNSLNSPFRSAHGEDETFTAILDLPVIPDCTPKSRISTPVNHVLSLIGMSAEVASHDSPAALHLSQASLNAANALASLRSNNLIALGDLPNA